MKKLLYSAAALATLLFASCQQENLEPVLSGGVTYTITLPTDVQTKGESGYAEYDLYYEVYRTTDVDVLDATAPLFEKKETMVGNTTTISLELLNDQNYTVLFWANKKGENYFNVEDLRNVAVLNALANNDDRDAFCGKDVITDINSDESKTVELKRPFAQINIATLVSTTAGYDMTPVASLVKVKDVPVAYNVASGEPTGNLVEVVYGKADVPQATITYNNETYTTVAMNYVLVPEANVTVYYEIETANGTVDNEIPNVPVRANYRTNIIGNLLTSNATYTIDIKPMFAGTEAELEIVNTAAGLQEAINNIPENASAEIVLDGDIDLGDLASLLATRSGESTDFITIPAGKEVVLNLNGYSISGADKTQKNFGLIQNNGVLTVKNDSETASKLSLAAEHNNGWNRYSAVISNNPGAELTVEGNVVIEHLGGTDMAYGIDILTNGGTGAVKATIDGATVTSTYRAIRQFLNSDSTNNELTIKAGSIIRGAENNKAVFFHDPSTKANKGNLTIEDGANVTGVYLFVTAGSTEWPVEVSIAASSIAEGYEVVSANVPRGYSVEEVDGIWTVEFYPVAKIGEKGYATLIDAVAAVQDGETITLVADEIFTETNRCDNGGWWDGLAYSGDKSFTIDLGGYTIKQDGSLNDYLMWIKNDGAKANTITLKNGTMDAGTTAYSAFATASSNKQTITVNLENINLINNISNGAVVKARGGSVLNVKAGTVITGKDSYVGIEAVGNNTVVNVYDGAKIYQNGTSSYVGAIIGASYNATLNIYGGEGKSAKCGIIVMSTGATINVSGGDWTANGDGTVAGGNQGVLVSQNNRNEKGWACKSILNVTGGTFKGGYDCWGMGPGQEPDDAQINISGGNFNANPASYLVNGYKTSESNGVYNVVVDPVAKIGETEYATLQEAFNVGGNVTLLRNVTITEPATLVGGKTAVLDLNGKTLTAELTSALVSKEGSELTVKNGKVVAYESTVRAIGGTLVVESGEYTSTGTALDSPATYRYSLDCREDGELIINGGTFKSNNGLINVSSKVTVNGGKFENIVEKTMTRHLAYVSALLTINGGEFSGQANGSAGGCFFCGAASGCDIQVNGGKFTSLWTSGKVNRIFEVYSTGASINVTGGMFNTNGGITNFVVANTDEATKDAYPYVAK